MSDLKNGTVKFFLEKQNYGFINAPEGGKDIFFHGTNVSEGTQLEKDSSVTYYLGSGKKGVEAVDIELESN